MSERGDSFARLLGEVDGPVAPRPEFADALLERLLDELNAENSEGTPGTGMFPGLIPSDQRRIPPPHPTGHLGRLGAPPASSPGLRRGAVAVLATAALVLLVFGASVLLLRGSHPAGIGGKRDLQAPLAAPTPEPGTSGDETLLAVTLPAAYFPHWDIAGSAFAHFSIGSNSETTWNHPAARVEYVISGTYTVRSDGPSQVVRAGTQGRLEAAPTGTGITLGPGDAMIAPPETVSNYVNSGKSRIDLLSWILTEGGDSDNPTPSGWSSSDVDLRPQITPPDGAKTVRLQRVDLATDGVLSAPPGVLQMGVTLPTNAAGTPVFSSIRTEPDGSLVNYGLEPVTAYVITVDPFSEATPMP